MQKWDYRKIDVIHTKLQDALEAEGHDGWELCGSTFLGKTWSLIFKRPGGEVRPGGRDPGTPIRS